MRKADIKIGMEAAISGYGVIAKVRVLEVGLPSPVIYKKTNTGVRFEVIEKSEDTTRFTSGRCETRDLDPWTSYHDEKLADLKAEAAFKERVRRVAARLEVAVSAYRLEVAVSAYADRVTIYGDDFFLLAERLGVETD